MEVAAYGVGDAEHLVAKEFARLWGERGWPAPEVDVASIARVGPGGRIAEEFAVEFSVIASVPVSAAGPEEAQREALRRSREALGGTRYARIEWVAVQT